MNIKRFSHPGRDVPYVWQDINIGHQENLIFEAFMKSYANLSYVKYVNTENNDHKKNEHKF